MVTTPTMLVRTTLYALLLQLVLVATIAIAAPQGAARLTTAGFVTPHHDRNFFAWKLAPVPWTDPTVYFSVQTMVQMLALALAAAALITFARTNPWQHGTLPESTPPPRDKESPAAKPTSPTPTAAAAAPPTPAPPPPPPTPPAA
jgi:hypothetical protein